MPHRDINIDALAQKQAEYIAQTQIETDKLYEKRKKILDKYYLTNENEKEYIQTLEQIKKIKDIPSKGEVEKSMYERIIEYEDKIANMSSAHMPREGMRKEKESVGLSQLTQDKQT